MSLSTNALLCAVIQSVTGSVAESGLGDTRECPVRPWTPAQTQARERKKTITFEEPFDGIPSVSLSVSRLDSNANFNLRLQIEPQDISATGFTVFIATWCNTQIYSIRVDYDVIGYFLLLFGSF